MPENESEVGERQPGFVPPTEYIGRADVRIAALDGVVTITSTEGISLDGVAVTALLTALAGGTTGQVLTKASNADYDFGWETP